MNWVMDFLKPYIKKLWKKNLNCKASRMREKNCSLYFTKEKLLRKSIMRISSAMIK